MIALQSLHVLDLEAVDEQVVQPDDGQGVLYLEPADESLQSGIISTAKESQRQQVYYLDKVCSFLEQCDVLCVFASSNLDIPSLQVESDLQLEVLHDGLEDLHPVLLQRGVSVSRHRDFPHLTAVRQLLSFDGGKRRLGLERVDI